MNFIQQLAMIFFMVTFSASAVFATNFEAEDPTPSRSLKEVIPAEEGSCLFDEQPGLGLVTNPLPDIENGGLRAAVTPLPSLPSEWNAEPFDPSMDVSYNERVQWMDQNFPGADCLTRDEKIDISRGVIEADRLERAAQNLAALAAQQRFNEQNGIRTKMAKTSSSDASDPEDPLHDSIELFTSSFDNLRVSLGEDHPEVELSLEQQRQASDVIRQAKTLYYQKEPFPFKPPQDGALDFELPYKSFE